MGEGTDEPHPTFVVLVGGDVVGWVDQEYEGQRHTWLVPGEVNIGYGLHPDARGKGLATRAVQLLMHHLAAVTDARVGTLAIDADNDTSLAVARRAGFGEPTPLNDGWLFKKPVPPLTYTDGTVTIRPFRQEDLDRDIAAKDDEQRRWLWLPEHREHWAAMTADERRAHALRTIDAHLADPRGGPKWSFVIDVGGSYAGHVDCDLANPDVPHGDANISYSSHPAERGKGYVSRAVRLIVQFVAEHTGAREAHIVVESGNDASLRVARAVGASAVGEFVNERGRSMIRHELTITR